MAGSTTHLVPLRQPQEIHHKPDRHACHGLRDQLILSGVKLDGRGQSLAHYIGSSDGRGKCYITEANFKPVVIGWPPQAQLESPDALITRCAEARKEGSIPLKEGQTIITNLL